MLPENYRKTLIDELKWQYGAPVAMKDIIVVARNQGGHVGRCLQSVRDNTLDYRLFVWDNGSGPPTRSVIESHSPHVLARSETNWGFIRPNNYLVALGSSPFVILLNSDVVVSPGWAEAMIGALHINPSCGVVGYQGGLLDDNFCGSRLGWGYDIDYVSGWCLCLRRDVYRAVGLFDTNLSFAYGEDSDFCLRVKQRGYNIYALHLSYAHHEGGVTLKAVQEERDVSVTFQGNHEYLKNKWANYLKYYRVLAKDNGK